MNSNDWKKELADLIRKHRLLPINFTGQVTLIFNQGGIRSALRGKAPQPIRVLNNPTDGDLNA